MLVVYVYSLVMNNVKVGILYLKWISINKILHAQKDRDGTRCQKLFCRLMLLMNVLYGRVEVLMSYVHKTKNLYLKKNEKKCDST